MGAVQSANWNHIADDLEPSSQVNFLPMPERFIVLIPSVFNSTQVVPQVQRGVAEYSRLMTLELLSLSLFFSSDEREVMRARKIKEMYPRCCWVHVVCVMLMVYGMYGMHIHFYAIAR